MALDLSDLIAYFRGYDTTNCDIRFPILVATANGEQIRREIIGFCKMSQTFADIKQDIKSKIANLKETDTDIQLPEEIDVLLLNGDKEFNDGKMLKNLRQIAANKTLNLQLKVLGRKYSIIVDAPLVRYLRLPSAICAGFSAEPAEFKSHNLHQESTKLIWYKSRNKEAWTKLHEGYQYNVQKDDVDYYLKLCCIPISMFGVKGPIYEAISENKVLLIEKLPKCPFELRHLETKECLKGNKFRVVSYNILADKYMDGLQFPYCSPTAQTIHYRKQLIIKELEGYNADIICLQEVDHPHFKSYYQNQLKRMGYKSFFNRKGNCIPEGLLCAFKHNRYRVLDYKHVVYKMLLDRKPFKEISDLLDLNDEVKADFIKQNSSLLTCVLEDKTTKKIVIVGNTHLFYRPDANHIRLLQAFMGNLQLFHLKTHIMKEYQRTHVAIVFCGDFNSDVSKSLYGFMNAGTIDPLHEDCLKIAANGDAVLHHKLRLTSACGTPKYTNYTAEFKGCLDYIFIDSTQLRVSRKISIPTEEELSKYEGLPNEVYPSDHLSLVVDLEFQKTKFF